MTAVTLARSQFIAHVARCLDQALIRGDLRAKFEAWALSASNVAVGRSTTDRASCPVVQVLKPAPPSQLGVSAQLPISARLRALVSDDDKIAVSNFIHEWDHSIPRTRYAVIRVTDDHDPED